jgi:hypothetical protein
VKLKDGSIRLSEDSARLSESITEELRVKVSELEEKVNDTYSSIISSIQRHRTPWLLGGVLFIWLVVLAFTDD